MKSSRSNGDGPEKSDSEEWGFDPGRKGMSTAGKIGLMLALLLVGAFAFVTYSRLHKQDDLVAQIKGMVESEPDGGADPVDSQSPPAQTDNPTDHGTQSASTPDGSYRSRTTAGQRSPAGSSTGSRSAFGKPKANSATAEGSERQEPNSFSDPGRRTPAADFPSSSPASDTRTTGYTTSASGSQPDPFTGNGASSRDARTTDSDGKDNPFDPQSEPSVVTAGTDGTADTQTDRAPSSDSGGGGTNRPSAGGDRSPASADAGPRPFRPRVADDTPAGATSTKPGSTGVAEGEFTDPWDSSARSTPQETTTETGGASDSQSGSDYQSVADSDPHSAVGQADQGNSGAVTSADTSAAFGTTQTSSATSTAPRESPSGSNGATSTGRVDPAESGSSFSPTPTPVTGGVRDPGVRDPGVRDPGVRDPFESASPRSGGSASGGEFGRSRPEKTHSEKTHSEKPRPVAYVVQAGDNYWQISKKLYGTGRYFTALARYNKVRIPDPRRMRPGMQILVPSRHVLETRYPDLRLKSRGGRVGNTQTLRKQLPSGFFRDAIGDPMYRIGARDTLSGIALRHLGRSSRWIQIRELNRDRLPDAANLKIGTVLKLPADASQVQLVRKLRDVR